MKPALIACALAMVMGLAPTETVGQEAAVATPTVSEWRQFQSDWEAGNHEAADAFARKRLAPGVPPKGLSEVLKYLVFERGRCDFDTGDSRIAEVLSHELLVKAGTLVCSASKHPEDEQASRAALAEMLALGRWMGRVHVFDAFARQPTINTAALQWLRRYDRFDPLPAVGLRGDDAMSMQIRAGRVENVKILLASGYDANHAILDPRDFQSDDTPRPARRGPLPLAVAREALSTRGANALEIVRLLLDAGADPYKLAWYPTAPKRAAAAPAPDLVAAFDALVEAAKPRHSPVGAEFVGLRFEYAPTGTTMYARFLVGNGGSATRSFGAWRADGMWQFDGLAHATDLETQLPGATDWLPPLRIEDGISPSTKIRLAQGESVEVLYWWSQHTTLSDEPGTRYRLRITHDGGDSHSDPFQPQFPQEPAQQVSLKAARDWYGMGPARR